MSNITNRIVSIFNNKKAKSPITMEEAKILAVLHCGGKDEFKRCIEFTNAYSFYYDDDKGEIRRPGIVIMKKDGSNINTQGFEMMRFGNGTVVKEHIL